MDVNERINWFSKNYNTPIIIDDKIDKKIYIGSPNQCCRFCGKTIPEVSFNKKAHAIPELIGNKKIFSNCECDSCNEHFGKFENSLSNFLGSFRTLLGIKGKKGIPKYESNDKLSTITRKGNRITINQNSNNPIIEEPDFKEAKMRLTQSYIPIEVYKMFVKMGISVMPYEKTEYFEELSKWLIEKKHTNHIPKYTKCCQTFIFGAHTFDAITGMLFFRKDDRLEVPFCQFVICFKQFMFQIVIPSNTQDKHLTGKTIENNIFPSSFEIDDANFKVKSYLRDLKDTNKTKVAMQIMVGYESLINAP